MHIVIIDDEKVLSAGIERKLLQNHYSVTVINSYKEYTDSDVCNVDLYLIDISLGDGNGFDIVSKLRGGKNTQHIPVLLMSGHDDVATKVEGLDIGADDYIVKPFDPNELLARVRSCLRKNGNNKNTTSIIRFHNINFDTAKRKVFIEGDEIILSKKEKQILEYFILHPKSLITKDQLLEKFWSGKNEYFLINNTINVTICNLRKKLGSSFQLNTIIGEGYYLETEEE